MQKRDWLKEMGKNVTIIKLKKSPGVYDLRDKTLMDRYVDYFRGKHY